MKEGGVIFEDDTETPVLGGGETIINIGDLPQIISTEYEYNQLEFAPEYGNCLCTAYGFIGSGSNNLGREIKEDERKIIVKSRVKVRFDKNVGGYLEDGAEIVAGLLNMVYYKIPKEQIPELLKKGYQCTIGMYVSNGINQALIDGIITDEEIEKIVDSKYGHCTILDFNYWQDNYSGVKQINRVKIEDIETFINSWFVYKNAYVMVSEDILIKYFKSKMTGNFERDGNYGVELMKNKEIHPKEYEIYKKLLKDIYINKKDIK